MQVSYSEGVASHTGPESCVGRREARDEALAGERVGWVTEPRKAYIPGCRRSRPAGRRNGGRVMRVPFRPCVVDDPSMRGSSLCGNREISRPAALPVAGRSASGRPDGRSR